MRLYRAALLAAFIVLACGMDARADADGDGPCGGDASANAKTEVNAIAHVNASANIGVNASASTGTSTNRKTSANTDTDTRKTTNTSRRTSANTIAQTTGERPYGTWQDRLVENGLLLSRDVVLHPPAHRRPSSVPCEARSRPPTGEDGEILLSYLDPDAIPHHVALAGDGERLWVGQGLNYARPQLFDAPDTLPEWEFAVSIGLWEVEVEVAVSNDGTLLAALAHDRAELLFFDPASPFSAFPLSIFELGTGERGTALALSRDGSTLAVGANTPSDVVKLYLFDTSISPPESLWTAVVPVVQWDYIAGIDFTDDGSVILVSTYFDWYAVDRDTKTIIQQNPNWGQTTARISGDGTCLVTGGFEGEVATWEWNPGVEAYEQRWTYWAGDDTWATAVAVSRDGSTVFAGTYDYGNLLDCSTIIFGSESSTPLWSYSEYGGRVGDVALSADGTRAVAGSWGDVGNQLWDLAVFSRESGDPLFALSAPGSFYAVDISDDGGIVAAGAKLVHAGILGRGGTTYRIAVGAGARGRSAGASGMRLEIETTVAPNPARGPVEIRWEPAAGAREAGGGSILLDDAVSVRIYNILGQPVATLDSRCELGTGGRVPWDGTDATGRRVGAGVYYYVVETGSARGTGELVLLR